MSCTGIQLVSISKVRPATHCGTTKRIELSPWDLMLVPVPYIQRGLLFTNPKSAAQSNQEETNIISQLKTSLSKTLDYFYPLAGRLVVTEHDDGTISFYINCNSVGAEFIHATADVTVADILDPAYVPPIVRSFFPLNEETNYHGLFQPLLSVQVTQLNDGIFIGCSVNHLLCDGTSFWHFMNSWSEISRLGAHHHISHSPILKRSFLMNTEYPIRLPFSTDEISAERVTPSSLIEERIFYFTPESVARLKANANSEINKSTNHHNISSLQALLAHFWVAAARARSLDPNEEISFQILMGNRARLNPPLPEEYFGNSVDLGVASVKVGVLLDKGPAWGALLLNQVVKNHDDTAIRSSWKSWVEKPFLVFFSKHNSSSSTLIAGSSPRFNMYGNDFGWGKPVAVRSGRSDKYDGKLTVSPGPVEGSVNVEACFYLETLKALADDAKFMEAVTVLPPFQNV